MHLAFDLQSPFAGAVLRCAAQILLPQHVVATWLQVARLVRNSSLAGDQDVSHDVLGSFSSNSRKQFGFAQVMRISFLNLFYHCAENDYKRNRQLNSKTVVPQSIQLLDRKIVTGLFNSKNIRSCKKITVVTDVHRCLFPFLSFFSSLFLFSHVSLSSCLSHVCLSLSSQCLSLSLPFVSLSLFHVSLSLFMSVSVSLHICLSFSSHVCLCLSSFIWLSLHMSPCVACVLGCAYCCGVCVSSCLALKKRSRVHVQNAPVKNTPVCTFTTLRVTLDTGVLKVHTGSF